MAAIHGDLVIGIFATAPSAQAAINLLKQAGFGDQELGLIAKHDAAHPLPAEEHTALMHKPNLLRGAEVGALAGAGLGSLWALAVVTGVIPVIGPVLAGGILASFAFGTLAGAASGSLMGLFLSLGLAEHESKYYEQVLHNKHIIVTVHSSTRQAEAASILNGSGAENIVPPSPSDTTDTPHLDLRPEHSATLHGGFSVTGGFADPWPEHHRSGLHKPRET